jgi:hypothetical protein
MYPPEHLRDAHYALVNGIYPSRIHYLKPIDGKTGAMLSHRKSCRSSCACCCNSRLSNVDWTRWTLKLKTGKIVQLSNLTTSPTVEDVDWGWPDEPFLVAVAHLARDLVAEPTDGNIEDMYKQCVPMLTAAHISDVKPLYGDSAGEADWDTWRFVYLDNNKQTWQGFVAFERASEEQSPVLTFYRGMHNRYVRFRSTPQEWPCASLDVLFDDAFLSGCPEEPPATPPLCALQEICAFPTAPPGVKESVETPASREPMPWNQKLRHLLIVLGDSCSVPGWYGAWIEGAVSLLQNTTFDPKPASLDSVLDLARKFYLERLRISICSAKNREAHFAQLNAHIESKRSSMEQVFSDLYL